MGEGREAEVRKDRRDKRANGSITHRRNGPGNNTSQTASVYMLCNSPFQPSYVILHMSAVSSWAKPRQESQTYNKLLACCLTQALQTLASGVYIPNHPKPSESNQEPCAQQDPAPSQGSLLPAASSILLYLLSGRSSQLIQVHAESIWPHILSR